MVVVVVVVVVVVATASMARTPVMGVWPCRLCRSCISTVHVDRKGNGGEEVVEEEEAKEEDDVVAATVWRVLGDGDWQDIRQTLMVPARGRYQPNNINDTA